MFRHDLLRGKLSRYTSAYNEVQTRIGPDVDILTAVC